MAWVFAQLYSRPNLSFAVTVLTAWLFAEDSWCKATNPKR